MCVLISWATHRLRTPSLSSGNAFQPSTHRDFTILSPSSLALSQVMFTFTWCSSILSSSLPRALFTFSGGRWHSRALIVGWDFIQPTPFRIPCYRDVVQGRQSADHFRQSSICVVLLFKHIHWLIRWSLATLCWRWLVSLCQLFHQPFLGLPPDWGCGAARDPLVRGATRWTLARGHPLSHPRC